MFSVNVTQLRQIVGKQFLADQDMNDVLDELGTYAFSEVSLNFEDMSRRKAGVDGTKWKELALSTEIVKAEKGGWRPSFKKKSDAASGIFGALKDIKNGVTVYKGKGKNKTPEKNHYGQSKRDTPPKSQIGVDNGLLRNAIVPGYSGGDKIYNVNGRERRVTIGFGREYAKYFDAVRPLIPEIIPEAWTKEMEVILGDFVEDMLRRKAAG